MRLYEFEASGLFTRKGIPVPRNAVVTSPQEAREKAEEIGLPVMLKAQVLTGGRGLAGAVQAAESLDQVERGTESLLASSVRGLPVQQVMVAQKVDVSKELYMGVTIDGYRGTPVAIVSSEGGVSVNQLVMEQPKSVAMRPVSISKGLRLAEAREMCREVGIEGHEDILALELQQADGHDVVHAEALGVLQQGGLLLRCPRYSVVMRPEAIDVGR